MGERGAAGSVELFSPVHWALITQAEQQRMSCVRDSLPNQIISYWQHLTLGVFTLHVGKSQKYGRNGAPPPLLLSINFLFKSCFQYICIQIIKFTKHAERLVWHHKLPGRFTEMKVKKKPTKNPTCVDVKPPSRGFDQHQLPYVRERLLCFCYIQRLFTFTAAEEVHTSSLKTVEIIRVFFFPHFSPRTFCRVCQIWANQMRMLSCS